MCLNQPTHSINRNILECKSERRRRNNFFVIVLIETYWNVNHYHLIVFDWFPPVLIETYWNVNRDVVDAMQKTRQCINRNILEGKYSYFSTYKSDLEY